MKEENPFDPLLDEIAEILTIYEKNKTKPLVGDPTPEDGVAMVNLINRVFAMEQAYKETLKNQGMTDQDVQTILAKDRNHLPPKQKQILDRFDRLKKEATQELRTIDVAIRAEKRKIATTGNVFKGASSMKDKKKNVHLSFRRGWKKM